jgi:hypothetical protein
VPLAELVSADRDGTQAWPHTVAAGKNAPTRRPTFGRFPVPGKRFGPSDGSAGSRGKSPEKKPADDEPPGGRSSADKPPVHEPPAGRPPDEKPPADPRKVAPQHSAPPEVLKPEPEQPKEGPENRHEPDGPKKDPFRLLGAAVDLPVLRANAGPDGQSGVPVVLGTLQLEPHALCVVELKGGQDAVPGNRHLSLDPQPHGNTWLIRLDAEGKQQPDGQRTDLARIWLEEQTLKFQWLSGAGRARGNYLRNCGLLVGVGNQTRWLPLGRPKTVEPLVLDLESGTARRSLPSAEWMPKIGKLRLQVTGLEGPFPAHKFRPASGISEDGQVDILLSGEKLPRVGLCVGLSSRGRVVSVQVSAVYQLANQVQRSLNRKDALGLAGEFYALQSRWQKTLDQLGEKDPRRADLSRQIDLLKESLEQLKALGDLYRRLHHTGKIHFRVFHTVGDHQIELFTTKPTTPVDGRVGPGP